MIGAEFLGMIMLIVYVGAVAVLFLFVVMMLNIASKEDKLNELFIIDAVKPNIKAKTEEKLAIKEAAKLFRRLYCKGPFFSLNQ